ncbi:MAG: hypothetical protein AB7I18_15050 [Candidatus Berkiella sp.]
MYEWWKAYVEGDSEKRKELMKTLAGPAGRRKSKRRKRKPAPT